MPIALRGLRMADIMDEDLRKTAEALAAHTAEKLDALIGELKEVAALVLACLNAPDDQTSIHELAAKLEELQAR
jgi:hypothetical protein